jgi:hypothetical protein
MRTRCSPENNGKKFRKNQIFSFQKNLIEKQNFRKFKKASFLKVAKSVQLIA